MIDRRQSNLPRAIWENWVEAYCDMMGRWPRSRLVRRPDLVWYGGPVAHSLFNEVLGTHCEGEEAESLLDEVLGDFTARGVPGHWWIFPSCRPADLGTRLQKRGLVREKDSPGMAVDLDRLRQPSPPAGFTLRSVESDDDLVTFVRIYAAGFEMPDAAVDALCEIYRNTSMWPGSPWHHYVGFLEGRAVASSSVFLGAGVAGLYDVATLPEARGRGIGAQMASAPLLQARKQGYRTGILQASQMGRPVYERLGFDTHCSFEKYRMDP